jgi:hypothetical protein
MQPWSGVKGSPKTATSATPAESARQAAGFDEFTRRLLRLLRDSRAARRRLAGREVVLGVHRSDYMLDAPSGGFLQVGCGLNASHRHVIT